MTHVRLALFLMLLLPGLSHAQGKEPAKAYNLDKVNTEADEVDPHVTSNTLFLLYSSNKNGTFDIWISKRTAPGPAAVWPAGKTHFKFSGSDERGPFIFKEWVYFAYNPVFDEKLKDLKNFDIFRKLDEQQPIPLPGIATPEDESFPHIAPGGKELYLSRKTKEGWKQMVADGPTPGPTGNVKEVGFPVGFHHASLTGSGLTMYLQGPVEGDRTGIYRSKRLRVGTPWSKPEIVQFLNHPEGKRGDEAPFITPDGTRLFWASDRPGGKGGMDIWTILIANLK